MTTRYCASPQPHTLPTVATPVQYLRQHHTNKVIDCRKAMRLPIGDAWVTRTAQLPCAVRTADCLPILLHSASGCTIGVIHAGWRGLARGIIGQTLRAMGENKISAWIGAAISSTHYVVGEEVRAFFADKQYNKAFISASAHHYFADLMHIARIQLCAYGVHAQGGELCTYSDRRFFSYRRNGTRRRCTTVIWLS